MTFSEIAGWCILILTIAITAIGIIITVEQVRKNRFSQRKSEYELRSKIEIDEYRRFYEEKIYSLQKELMANERRWKDVNHLIISGQSGSNTLSDNPSNNSLSPTKFFRNIGIDPDEIIVEKKSVFVLTPFSTEGTKTFDVIKKVCGEVDLKCSRGDEVFRNNNILSHIIASILQANIIIANIDGRNPNVFYELGICHTIGKAVIIISNMNDKLPFDINAKNIIFYTDSTDLQLQLRSELLKIFIDDNRTDY